MLTNITHLIANLDTSSLPKATADNNHLQTFFTVVIGIFGAVSFLMIVIGGLNYILANGDPAAITKAKNIILYSVIGLVISMSAYGIVAFVVGQV